LTDAMGLEQAAASVGARTGCCRPRPTTFHIRRHTARSEASCQPVVLSTLTRGACRAVQDHRYTTVMHRSARQESSGRVAVFTS
jgi:hypothetical protein